VKSGSRGTEATPPAPVGGDKFRYFEDLYRLDSDPWHYGERGAELLRHESIAEVAARVPHERILEVGCSAGSLTARLVSLGRRVVAMDLSPTAVGRARAEMANGGKAANPPTFLVGSVTALPIRSGAFDLVVASDGPHGWYLDASHRAVALRQLHDALSPGGHVLITEFLRPHRFPDFVAEVAASPLSMVEVRYLYDRPWYRFERWLKRWGRHAHVRRWLGSVRIARILDRFGAAFGARGARHILILTQRSY
jgi:SAM-dependent methyltransferase